MIVQRGKEQEDVSAPVERAQLHPWSLNGPCADRVISTPAMEGPRLGTGVFVGGELQRPYIRRRFTPIHCLCNAYLGCTHHCY